jgi:hypothetical protein
MSARRRDTDAGSLRPLRDWEPGDAGSADVAARARALIRAIDSPGEVAPEAHARVLATLAAARARPGLGTGRARRWLVPALAVVGNLGTGLAAAAALRWIHPAPAAPALGAESSSAAVAHAPVPIANPASTTVMLSPHPAALPPRRRGGVRATLPGRNFVRARLAINPKDERHRPDISADFARAHAGEIFSWRVEICVSPEGEVASATLLDQIDPQLDHQVGRAIATWKYFPAQHGSRAVHTCTALSYRLAIEPPGWTDDPPEDGAD